jgi:GNAT superfamily N-acetyltransferase
MIDPTVREAVLDDTPQLRWLESEARAALADQRGGVRWLDTHTERGPEWPTAIGGHSGGVVVAHIDDVLVGYLVLTIEGVLSRVEEVYVTPRARELGFGDALLDAALDLARQAGCSLLEGESLPGDRDTKNLYERAGIKARLITVSTEI